MDMGPTICRTCLQEITGKSPVYDLDSLDLNSKTMCIQNMLYYCIPELDLNLTKDKTICVDCVAALDAAYKLKTQCLQAQEFISACLKDRNLALNDAFLKDLIIIRDNNPASLSTNEAEISNDLNQVKFVNKQLNKEDSSLVHASGGLYINSTGNAQMASENEEFISHNETEESGCNSSNADTSLPITNNPLVLYKMANYRENVEDCYSGNCNPTDNNCEHEKISYNCALCTYNIENKTDMLNHIKESHQDRIFESRVEKESQSSEFGGNLGSKDKLQDEPLPHNNNIPDELINIDCDTVILINDRIMENTVLLNSSNLSQDNAVFNAEIQKDCESTSISFLKDNNQNNYNCGVETFIQNEHKNSNITENNIINEADSDDERYDYLDDIHNEEEQNSLADRDIPMQQNDKHADTIEGSQSSDHNTVVAAAATNFTCDKCSFTSYVKEDYENHLINSHNESGGNHNVLHNKRSCKKNINYNDNEKSRNFYIPVSKIDSKIYKMKFKRKKNCFKCRTCNYTTTSESYLKKHKKAVHKPRKSHAKVTKKIEENKYKCTACNFASVTKGELNSHITTHLDKGYYKCEICSYLSVNEDIILRHEIKNHNFKKSYSCPKCNRNFVHRPSFKHHMKSAHLDTKCFKCNICDLTIPHKHVVEMLEKQHAKKTTNYGSSSNVNSIKKVPTKNSRKKRSSRCKLCKKKFASKTNVREHMKTHWSCKSCSFIAVTKRNAIVHRRLHPESFTCNTCNFDTNKKVHIKLHMAKKHDITQLYICDNCCFHTKYRNGISGHLETHKK